MRARSRRARRVPGRPAARRRAPGRWAGWRAGPTSRSWRPSCRPPPAGWRQSRASIAVICSTYSGLPSAAATMRARTAASSPTEQLFHDRGGVLGSQRGERDEVRLVAGRPRRRASPAARGGRSARSRIGRAVDRLQQVVDEVEERRRGGVDVVDDRDQRSLARERLEQLADAPEQLGELELRAGQADGGPDAFGDRRPGRRPTAPRPRASAAILATPRRAVVVARCPAAARTISPIGQNVMPSPYGRHRPRTTSASVATGRANSRMSRDFPTPASPTTVTSRAARWPSASSSASRRRASSAVPAHERGGLPWSLGRPVADAEQAERGDRLGLALEGQWLDGLHDDVVASEPVGQVARG